MSIKNELSSDIAVALLARGENDPQRLEEMKELILRIHATLQEHEPAQQARAHAKVAAAHSRSPVEPER